MPGRMIPRTLVERTRNECREQCPFALPVSASVGEGQKYENKSHRKIHHRRSRIHKRRTRSSRSRRAELHHAAVWIWSRGGRATTTPLDYQGDANGTLQNGATFAPGMVGQAFSFDGVDDQIFVPHNANQNTASQITIDAWVNPSSSGLGRPIAQKRSSSNVGGYTFETGDSDGLLCGIWIGGTLYTLQTPANVLTIGTFQHVAATYDGAMMRIYVNGIEKASMAVSGTIDPTTDPVIIGRDCTQPFLPLAWFDR